MHATLDKIVHVCCALTMSFSCTIGLDQYVDYVQRSHSIDINKHVYIDMHAQTSTQKSRAATLTNIGGVNNHDAARKDA